MWYKYRDFWLGIKKGESMLLRFLFIFSVGFCTAQAATEKRPKVLHLSFHKGCVMDFEDVGRQLGLDLTSWYILDDAKLDRINFDGISRNSAIYNISHERAQRAWEKHKDYFNQFDVIVTSDTAPLSRVFLQHGWQKPLIIWICNRFDYCDLETHDGTFPDPEYYELFKKALKMPNVRVIGYTPYEHFYASTKGINTDWFTIKPLGSIEHTLRVGNKTHIPENVDKESTLFIYPRLDEEQMRYVQAECGQRSIPTYTGTYNGPHDLAGFKGIIYFPYAWSNLAVFENFHQGIIHFVPSERFILQNVLFRRLPIRCCTYYLFNFVEWYMPEYYPYMVYFDSWDDLKQKIATTNYDELRAKVKAFGKQHRAEMLTRWRSVFSGLGCAVSC